jgi:SMODS and SLOG-associating 2TM effector domain 3/SMODS and SLOG-associating 2TM effector domain 1
VQPDIADYPPATQTAARPTTCSVDPRDYPTLYQVASKASRSSQRLYVRSVWLNLALVVLASALGTVAAFVSGDRKVVIAFLITISMFGALIVSVSIRGGRHDRYWFGGRAVAESVKTSAWRYMMRAEPYNTDDDIAEQGLLATLKEILASDAILSQDLPAVPGVAITPRMRQIRALPMRERKACYQLARVQNQLDWYSTKAAANRRAARAWLSIGVGAQGAALVAAVLGMLGVNSLDLIGVFAAAAAAATALSQLHRHDELAKSYALAALELNHLKDLIDGVHREVMLQDRVKDTEAAISREHTMWVARRDRIP